MGIMFKSNRNFNANRLFIIACLTMTMGCGSVITLLPGTENRIRHMGFGERTNCRSIPRVYSGVSLDVCTVFIGPPASVATENEAERAKRNFYGYMMDIALSFVIDTLALPYTIYRQYKDGNIPIKRKIEYPQKGTALDTLTFLPKSCNHHLVRREPPILCT